MKLIISILVLLAFIGCGEEKKSEQKTQAPVQTTKPSVVQEKVTPVAKVKTPKEIYATCATCHGINAEKAALGKSEIIQGWSSEKIIEAINGYKDGTYGKTMKATMKPQVAKLSNDEIQAVAQYISTLQ